jgi:hypothetical protein
VFWTGGFSRESIDVLLTSTHLVCMHGTLTRAVVVADENISVDVAETDEVVRVLVAGVDAGLVTLDASVYNVLGIALVLGSDKASRG